ncbi:hypothetical protein ABEB36_013389 [Hypothenemus hampei]|uniref:BMP-binding endothelial regulator protein n=1 Tax=Hypothenemus hampei TaxID=57062 RepID=A0ABD1E8R5_HYPHA
MDVIYKYWSLVLVMATSQAAFAVGKYGSYGTEMAPLPAGTRQTCTNEGEPVNTMFDAQIVDCFPCICKNGYVECENKCPRIDECPLVAKGTCCTECKGCTYKGILHSSHTEWLDPLNPCKVFRCEASVVTVSDLQCYTPCGNPLPPEPGKCCSTCPVCKINGQIVAEGRDVISEDDPCLKCRCTKGKLTCTKRACPVLPCDRNIQYRPTGECCPKCNGTRTVPDTLLQTISVCMIGYKVYRERDSFNVDKCTNCSCAKNNTSVCSRNACPILDCAVEQQRHSPNGCCPTCEPSNPQEFIDQCVYQGRIYQDGNEFQIDKCTSCICVSGKLKCARPECKNTCDPGMELIRVKGDCCKKCVEKNGTCMAFGDPHYKTFDGKIYTFKGMGKYQLINDCQNGTFSIKVANYKTHKFMDSTITKRVAINFGNDRLNLQQHLRVKYNGQRIIIPFKKEGVFKISKMQGAMEVRLNNDVVILWNGRSFLEVSVPPTYKGKLCGLCGNFNGDVQDDLRNRAGKIVEDRDLLRFGSSWCVGKKTECAKNIKPYKKQGDVTPCKYFNNDIFADCRSKLNNNKYYMACKMDMHSCANRNINCFCESLMAYSRECERLGVVIPHWQNLSHCTLNNSSRLNIYRQYGKKQGRTSLKSSMDEDILRYNRKKLQDWAQLTPKSSRKPIPIN